MKGDNTTEEKHSEEFEDTGYKVVAKVISQKGTCSFGHKVGDTVVFDGETVDGRVCFSALTASFPKSLPCTMGSTFPGLMTRTCPPMPVPMPTTRWSLSGYVSRVGTPERAKDWKSLAEIEKRPFDYAQGRPQALDQGPEGPSQLHLYRLHRLYRNSGATVMQQWWMANSIRWSSGRAVGEVKR